MPPFRRPRTTPQKIPSLSLTATWLILNLHGRAMRWNVPPSRRELYLTVFSVSVFYISYYAQIGIDWLAPISLSEQYSSHLAANPLHIGPDGRRLQAASGGAGGWFSSGKGKQDNLEDEIYGSWPWEENQIAGDGKERTREGPGEEPHRAMWVDAQGISELSGSGHSQAWLKSAGGGNRKETLKDAFVHWGKDVPVSTIVRHVPGYTILDNVVMFKGKTYVILGDVDWVPSLSEIVHAAGPGMMKWEYISKEKARETFGTYGQIIRGVTWISSDTTPHNSTLVALQRLYSSAAESISPSGKTSLLPPERLIFPHRRVFTDPNPLPHFHLIRRRRTDTGFHPFTLKAAFPTMTVMYQEDWEDYHKLPAPYVLERVVISDMEAAEEARKSSILQEDDAHRLPPFSGPFVELDGVPENWWEPVRRNLLDFLAVEETKQKKEKEWEQSKWKAKKKVKGAVTYLHRQHEEVGVKLRDVDHKGLLIRLKSLEKLGYEVHIISSRMDETGWEERMMAIVQSTVILGASSSDLFDAVFLKPTPNTTIMEFFSDDAFTRNQEVLARSLRIKHVGWRAERIDENDLPPVQELDFEASAEARINVDAVIESVKQALTAR